ncbi:MAG: hypothetical protein HQK62_10765 [Desulfamplus sp.]|nr:hypothetical protein [Desulfamplus sp.]
MEKILLLVHPMLGGLATLSALWVFVDTLNVCEANQSRIKNVSILCALLMWLTYFLGGIGIWFIMQRTKQLSMRGPGLSAM